MKYLTLILLFISCTKTQERRAMGVISSDLPIENVLMSDYHFRKNPPKKGKPPVDTTIIITPPPPPTYSGGYQIPMPPVISQGREGSCVSFAIGYYIRSSYTSTVLSPEYLFNQTAVNYCAGSTLLSNLKVMTEKGICSFQSMPYSDQNCTQLPTFEQDLEAANYKISSYSIVYTADSLMLKNLLNNKHPLYISFNVDNNFYYAGPSFIWKSFSGTIGQHAVALVGYDDSIRAWKIVNSWGTGWGDKGYSWIDYNFLTTVTSIAVKINI